MRNVQCFLGSYVIWNMVLAHKLAYKQAATLFYLTGNTGIPSVSYIEFWSLLNEKRSVFLRKLCHLEHWICLMNRYAKIISHKQPAGNFLWLRHFYAFIFHLYTVCLQY
jgi:hypothetical protein